VKPVVLAALVAFSVIDCATALAQDDFYSLRWSVAAGPGLATPSGNKLTLTGNPGCYTCGRTFQRVVGATDARYHAVMNVAGDIGYDLTIRGELNYSHATSRQTKLPRRVCPPPGIYTCFQDRKALIDNAWYLGGGLEWAPYKQLPVVPYVTASGGLTLNKFAWNWDTTGTVSIPTTRAKAFGSYVTGGAGFRARYRNMVAFIETRRFMNFSTPGTAMISFSFGLQYWARYRDYGY
jgi:hypothetical protein